MKKHLAGTFLSVTACVGFCLVVIAFGVLMFPKTNEAPSNEPAVALPPTPEELIAAARRVEKSVTLDDGTVVMEVRTAGYKRFSYDGINSDGTYSSLDDVIEFWLIHSNKFIHPNRPVIPPIVFHLISHSTYELTWEVIDNRVHIMEKRTIYEGIGSTETFVYASDGELLFQSDTREEDSSFHVVPDLDEKVVISFLHDGRCEDRSAEATHSAVRGVTVKRIDGIFGEFDYWTRDGVSEDVPFPETISAPCDVGYGYNKRNPFIAVPTFDGSRVIYKLPGGYLGIYDPKAKDSKFTITKEL